MWPDALQLGRIAWALAVPRNSGAATNSASHGNVFAPSLGIIEYGILTKIPPPNRPESQSSDPDLWVVVTDDGSRTLKDRRLGETYHSGCGALAESWHAYLVNSGVAEKLRQRSSLVSVLEIGFGTGLAFVLTATHALCHGASLQYTALDCRLLPTAILEAVELGAAIDAVTENDWPSFNFSIGKEVVARFIDWRRVLPEFPADGVYAFDVGEQVRLNLVIGDAQRYRVGDESIASFDAIYFDAFSPQSNPELWSESTFRTMLAALKPGGVLVSYCVKSSVRSTLERVGFRVARAAGPPKGKREVLRATKPC